MAEIGTMAGATLMVVKEASFGSPLSTDAWQIDTATIGAADALSVRLLRASFNTSISGLRQRTVDNAETSYMGGTPPLMVESVVGTSGPEKQISGELQIEMVGMGVGSGDAEDTFLGWLLDSSLSRRVRTAGASLTGIYGGLNAFTVADAALLQVGDVVYITQTDGTARLVHISDISTLTVTTAEAHGIPETGTATVRLASEWYQPPDGDPDGDSLAIQVTGRDGAFTYLLTGCQLKSLAIEQMGAMQVKYAATIAYADGLYDTSAIIGQTAALPLGVATTTHLRTSPSRCLISADHSASSAPWAGAVAAFPLSAWAFRIDCTLQPIPDLARRCQMSGRSVTSAMLSGSITQAAPVTGVDFREVLRLSAMHTASITATGAKATAGASVGVWVGCIQPTEDPGVTHEDTRRVQTVAWRAGDYAGDTYAEAAPETANCPWLLALMA